MFGNKDFVRNPNTGGMDVLDRLYKFLSEHHEKLSLLVNRDTMFRLLQGIGVDFFFKTGLYLSPKHSMKASDPAQIDELTILTINAKGLAYDKNTPTMIFIEDRRPGTLVPILSSHVKTKAVNIENGVPRTQS